MEGRREVSSVLSRERSQSVLQCEKGKFVPRAKYWFINHQAGDCCKPGDAATKISRRLNDTGSARN